MKVLSEIINAWEFETTSSHVEPVVLVVAQVAEYWSLRLNEHGSNPIREEICYKSPSLEKRLNIASLLMI